MRTRAGWSGSVRGRALAALSLLAFASGAAALPRGEGATTPNVLLVVLDDFGVDLLGCFPRLPGDPPAPFTPELDRLAADGLLFTRAWTDPICSPSRAQILTGRHGFRTGIGCGIGCDGGTSLRVDLETTLPRVLVGYDSAAVGKWHLMSLGDGTLDHPLDAGFGAYAGALYNLGESTSLDAPCLARGPLSYANWLKTWDVAGSGRLASRCERTYATTDTTNDALARARTMRAPWFLYVAYNAPHWPLNRPPKALCARRDKERVERRDAMVEALDREFGRLLAGVRREAPDTVVIVVGDNGTDPIESSEEGAGETLGLGTRRGKASVFESGIHVPLIVAGPGVVTGRCDALVGSTDLFATVAELAGSPATTEDAVSLVPYLRGETKSLRRTVYAEGFFPNQPDARLGLPFAPSNHGRALRDERFKLVRMTLTEGNRELFYDLERDPREEHDLLASGGVTGLADEARAHYDRLLAELQAMGVD